MLLVLLLAYTLLAFVPGVGSVPPIDRDEPRYTQASKQMLESGDYVDIRFQDEPRYKKPIGIYWLQAASAAIAGEGAGAPLWAYRIPSVIGGIAAVLLTVWAARAFVPFPAAVAAGFLIAATATVGFEARVAKTDAVLLATIVLAQGALARIWLSQAARLPFAGWPLVFWLAVAAATLVKGPIVWLVSGLTVAALTAAGWRDRGWLRRLRIGPGLAVTALVAAPWFAAIWIASDGAFFTQAVGTDFLGKAATGQEGHWAPPLAHLAAFLGTGWPLSAFALLAAPAVWRLRRVPAVVFALAWAVPAWIVFELVPTKLPHYTLPLLPAVALMAAAALFSARFDPGRRLRRAAAALLVLVPAAIAAATVALPLALGDAVVWPAVALAAVAAALAFAGAGRLARSGSPPVAALGPAVAASLLLGLGVWGLALPRLDRVWLSPRLAQAARQAADCSEPTLVSVGFNEPSLVFLAGTGTRLLDPEKAVAALPALDCYTVAVDRRFADRFQSALDRSGTRLVEAGEVIGLNISNGRALRLRLYRPAP